MYKTLAPRLILVWMFCRHSVALTCPTLSLSLLLLWRVTFLPPWEMQKLPPWKTHPDFRLCLGWSSLASVFRVPVLLAASVQEGGLWCWLPLCSNPGCAAPWPRPRQFISTSFHFSVWKLRTSLPCYSVLVRIRWDQSLGLSFKDDCCFHSKQLKYPPIAKWINTLSWIHTMDCSAVKGNELLIHVTI